MIYIDRLDLSSRPVTRQARGYSPNRVQLLGEDLSFVQRNMNTMIHSSTGVKPCEIILSNEMTHEPLKLVRKEDTVAGGGVGPSTSEKPEWEDLWIDRLKERQRWYVEKAAASLKAMDDLHRSVGPVITTRYATGSRVLSEQGTAFRRGPVICPEEHEHDDSLQYGSETV